MYVCTVVWLVVSQYSMYFQHAVHRQWQWQQWHSQVHHHHTHCDLSQHCLCHPWQGPYLGSLSCKQTRRGDKQKSTTLTITTGQLLHSINTLAVEHNTTYLTRTYNPLLYVCTITNIIKNIYHTIYKCKQVLDLRMSDILVLIPQLATFPTVCSP